MISTRACEVLGCTDPIVQAGMAFPYTTPELVAAVSDAGGVGILGCLGRSLEDTVAAIGRIRALTDRPFGVNFVLHRLDEQVFAACLEARVPVFAFFRGDPAEATERAHAAGAVVMHQVTTPQEAARACEVGVDVLIAQGCEAGGHMGPLPLHSLLPVVVDLAGERPVLGAGGIVDGRDLAALMCLGASGAMLGTRFLATPESGASDGHRRAILAAAPGDTVASGIFDLLWDTEWPGVQARAIHNAFAARWVGRDHELIAARDTVLAGTHRAEAVDDSEERILLAGEGAGRINSIAPAAQLVADIVAEAERVLGEWGRRLHNVSPATQGS